MKKWLLAFFILIAGCAAQTSTQDEKISIVASFYVLGEFAQAVAGDKANVYVLVPTGVEPHEWEPSPHDIARITNADVLLYNGAGFEGWIDKALKIIGRKTTVIEATSELDLISINEDSRGKNPHVWLDPTFAARIIEKISNTLSNINPSGAEYYRFNAINYIARLNNLDEKFKKELVQCARREFITAHDAFGYLARRYNLVQIPIAGISTETEPTPKYIARLIDLIKSKKVKTIFAETMVNPKIAEMIARDTGATIDVLNPLEGLSETKQDYFIAMEQNLNKLKNALSC